MSSRVSHNSPANVPQVFALAEASLFLVQDREIQWLQSPQFLDSSDTEYDVYQLLNRVRQILSKGKTKIDIAQLTFVFNILWAITVAFIRSSIIFLYIRIFPSRSFCLACYAILILNVAFSIGVMVACFLDCRPLACLWDGSIRCASCFQGYALDAVHAGFNLALDVTVVVLPTPMLWGLQMPVRKKVLLSGMFGLGIL